MNEKETKYGFLTPAGADLLRELRSVSRIPNKVLLSAGLLSLKDEIISGRMDTVSKIVQRDKQIRNSQPAASG